jgi:hypothetical protein
MKRVLLVAAVALSLFPSLRLLYRGLDVPNFGTFHDDALYYVAARSLAEGSGYKIESLPGMPYQTKYPPLFSWILSWAWWISPEFPENLSIAALLVWLPLPFFLGFSYLYFRRMNTSAVAAAALTAALALNPWCGYLANSLLSELWLATLLIASIVLLESDGARKPLFAGAVGALAFLVRAAALPLLVTAPAVLALQKKLRQAVLFGAAMLPAVAGWFVWSKINRSPVDGLTPLYYLDYTGYYLRTVTFADLPLLVFENINTLLVGIGDMILFDGSDTPLGFQVVRLLGVGAIAGGIRAARVSGRWHFAAFAVVQIGILVIWNFPPHTRFTFLLLPWLWHGVWFELSHLAQAAQKSWGRRDAGARVAAVVTAGLIASFLAGAASHAREGWRQLDLLAHRHRADRAAMQPIYAWMTKNLPGSGKTMLYSERDPLNHLFTRRGGFSVAINPLHFYKKDDQAIVDAIRHLRTELDLYHVKYVLLTPNDFDRYPTVKKRLMAEMKSIVSDASRYEKLVESGGNAIYRVIDP